MNCIDSSPPKLQSCLYLHYLCCSKSLCYMFKSMRCVEGWSLKTSKPTMIRWRSVTSLRTPWRTTVRRNGRWTCLRAAGSGAPPLADAGTSSVRMLNFDFYDYPTRWATETLLTSYIISQTRSGRTPSSRFVWRTLMRVTVCAASSWLSCRRTGVASGRRGSTWRPSALPFMR